MEGSEIFIPEKIAKKMGVSSEKLRRLKQSVRKEFPHDDLMYELHLLRALKSIRRKKLPKASTN